MSSIFVHGGIARKIEPKKDAISVLAEAHWKMAREKDPHARYEDSLKEVARAEPTLWEKHAHNTGRDL